MKALHLVVLTAMLMATTKTRAQVSLFNSYPSATAVVFLDFDGELITGTNWNISGPLHCGPSNLDAAQITEIYNRIAEDYRPFAINITTDSTMYDKAPIDRRMRVLFTITSDWYGVAGGVSYVNSFTWGNGTPCFVFTALHKYNIKNIAEAGAHEAGHTMGLRHQAMYDSSCNKISDYNAGTGSGAVGWAPIMGVGYYRNNTTWHYGPNPFGCTSEQDDLAIITSRNGFGYRPDENTATDFTKAIFLNSDSSALRGDGLIATNTDADLFHFAMPAGGPLTLDVHPYSIAANDEGSNLDVELRLYNKNQQLIKTYNPEDKLSVDVDTVLPSGDYYISISGAGNAFTSSYASLGAYTISGTVPDVAPVLSHAIQLRGNTTGSLQQLNWIINAGETATKQVLEYTQDGRTFLPVATLAPDARSYAQPTTAAARYRLTVQFASGSRNYSNTVLLQPASTAKPRLYTTVIHGNTLEVNSPAGYTYSISDMAGQGITTGVVKAGANAIHMGNLKSGLYVISFENGTQRTAEKFVRE